MVKDVPKTTQISLQFKASSAKQSSKKQKCKT